MNNRQISGDVLNQKRQALQDMLNGNVTAASQDFAKETMIQNEHIDRNHGRVKTSKESSFTREDSEKEIGDDVFDVSSRIQQQQQQYQQQPQQYQQQPQQQYQQPQQQQYQPQQPQQQYQQPINENQRVNSSYGNQLPPPVPSHMVKNMLDGKNYRGNQGQQEPQQSYYQPNQYQQQPSILNEDTKRELANDIVERIKTSFLREEIMSVLMEDVFSTDRMNKILTENFERLLKSYMAKQSKIKAANNASKK